MDIPTLWQLFFGEYLIVLAEWFYAAMLMLPVSALILKQKSIMPAALVMITGTVILRPVIPGGQFGIMIAFAVSMIVAYVVYRLFIKPGK